MPDKATAELAAMADLATPMAIRVAATLRIADLLPATTTELATATCADADALDLVLRHLVTAGVLTREVDADRYAVTELGAGLCADHPAGLRSRWDIKGAPGHADLALAWLLNSVRSGAAAYNKRLGDNLGVDAPLIVSAYDWGALGHVVDVGGDGTLLVALLTEYPALRGTAVDLPGPAEAARRTLDAAGLADRANAVAGDVLDELPAGAEGYLLNSVLHHRDDAEARTILRNCATAAGEDGAVFVIEWTADTVGAGQDLSRLVLFGGGRQRDVGELTVLAESAGLTVAAMHTAGAISIIELAVV